MALITLQNISESGITPTLTSVAASGGDTFANSGSCFVMIVNTSGETTVGTAAVEVTTVDSSQYGSLTKAAQTISTAAGATSFFGPFAPAAYNDQNGIMTVSFSATTDVTIAILTVGN